jgi:hypothetical protein
MCFLIENPKNEISTKPSEVIPRFEAVSKSKNNPNKNEVNIPKSLSNIMLI